MGILDGQDGTLIRQMGKMYARKLKEGGVNT
jgi:hypothetical protein